MCVNAFEREIPGHHGLPGVTAIVALHFKSTAFQEADVGVRQPSRRYRTPRTCAHAPRYVVAGAAPAILLPCEREKRAASHPAPPPPRARHFALIVHKKRKAVRGEGRQFLTFPKIWVPMIFQGLGHGPMACPSDRPRGHRIGHEAKFSKTKGPLPNKERLSLPTSVMITTQASFALVETK